MPTITLLSSGPVDAPSPLPVDLEDAIAATQGYAQEALTSKNAAATAATAAQTARTAADADAAATAEDRTAVHADRVAADTAAASTASDRTAVHTDRLAADADADATAADRTAVHADRLAADASAADARATEQRLRQQSLGSFADDAAAVAWAAAQSPAITIITGTSYLNTTSDIFRYAVVSAGPTITWHDVTEDEAAQAVLAQASATAAAASAATALTSKNTAVTAKDDAQTAATAAAASQSAASISATNAAASASAAATNKTATDTNAANASASATAALGAYNNTNALLSSVSASAVIAQQAAASAQAVTGLSILAAAQRAIKLTTALVSGAAVAYDTTKDDDAGAWPAKCKTQSYLSETLNTATRGTVAAVPAQMIVSGETTVLSVFMGTDGLGALWKSWTVAGLTCVFARAGSIWYGGTGGLYRLDLITDEVYKRDTSGLSICNNQNVATFNQGTATWTLISSAGAIASASVYSVTAFTAPNSQPNRLRYDLQHQTVFVGHASGSSTIRWDGVVNASSLPAVCEAVAVDKWGTLYQARFSANAIYYASNWQTASYGSAGIYLSLPTYLGTYKGMTIANGDTLVIGASLGLLLIKIDPTNPANSLYRVKTTTYDTGWMVLGKTVLAMAESSALLAAATEAALVSDDFGSYADTTALQAAWGTLTAATVALNSGKMRVTKTAATSVVNQTTGSLSTIAGRYYRIEFDYNVISSTGNVTLWASIASTLQGAGLSVAAGASGRYVGYYLATSTTTSRTGMGATTSTDAVIDVDNFAAYQVQAADWSGSGNHAKVVGSLTRAQVVSGADLAGLTGWGVGNYVLGSAIALGTADFEFPVSVVGASITGTQTYLAHGYYTGGAYSGSRVLLQSSTSTLTATFHDGTNSASISVASALVAGGNYDLRVIYRSALTRFELWSNGALIGTAARGSVGSLTNASGNLFIGVDPALANPTVSTVILALIRAYTYATTPDQIAFMRADEKSRFVANAKELLSGASVQAVAFDPDTGQLAASNSTAGTDVFAGPGFSVRVANWKSTTGANIAKGASFPSSWTFVAASVGSKVAGPASWGGGEAWQFLDTTGNAQHTANLPAVTFGSSTPCTFAVPVQAGTQGFAAIWCGSSVYGFVNLSTGATGPTNGTMSAYSLGSGWWLVAVQAALNGSVTAGYVQPATAASLGALGYVGTGGSALQFGKPMLIAGSYTATQMATMFVDALSANDNHKAVAFAGGDLVVATGAGVDAFLGVKPGLRETAGGQGAPKRAFYDPTWGQYFGVTTDATPTVFASIPIPEGKAHRFRASVVAVMYGGTATEKAVYDITGVVSRDIGGNVVVVSTTTTISEVTSTMDCVAQANTTAQTLEIKATGKASTRIAWFDGQELYDVGLMAAA